MSASAASIANPQADIRLMEEVVDRQRTAFRAGKSKSYDFRISQLKRLESMLRDNENEFTEALMKDLGRCRMEAVVRDM
jgi:aldehyde dehydrogenase (NAD+)